MEQPNICAAVALQLSTMPLSDTVKTESSIESSTASM
jgi:hypothetical protein